MLDVQGAFENVLGFYFVRGAFENVLGGEESEIGDVLSMGHDGRVLAMSLLMEGCKKNLNANCNLPLRSRAM
ncbi:unnamed protein product [Rhodiola kirilowii]